MHKQFNISYLPLFEEDLAAVRDYIAFNLQNPAAALRLVEDTEKAIIKRSSAPLGYKPYHSLKNRKQPYYRINIRNYSVFYVVIGDTMEVRRFVYGKRNLPDII